MAAQKGAPAAKKMQVLSRHPAKCMSRHSPEPRKEGGHLCSADIPSPERRPLATKALVWMFFHGRESQSGLAFLCEAFFPFSLDRCRCSWETHTRVHRQHRRAASLPSGRSVNKHFCLTCHPDASLCICGSQMRKLSLLLFIWTLLTVYFLSCLYRGLPTLPKIALPPIDAGDASSVAYKVCLDLRDTPLVEHYTSVTFLPAI